MSTHFVRSWIAAAVFAGAAGAAGATTYDASSYPFSYRGVTGASIQVTSSVVGTFNTSAEILQFLNGTSFSAVLTNASGALVTLDNSNATWSLSYTGTGTSAVLDADGGRLKLGLFTPDEYSGVALMLKSADGRSVFQMRQENNVTDYAFVNFSYDAMFTASAVQSYSDAFGLWATAAAPVPEVSSSLLFAVSLPLVGLVGRRRRR